MGQQDLTQFMCPEGVNPLLFSQLCVFYYSNVWKNNTLGATSEVMSQNIESSKSPKTDDLSKKKDQLNFRKERWSYRTGHNWLKTKSCLCPR